MTSEKWAVATLIALVVIAVGVLIRGIRRCPDGWETWFLYHVARLYGGFGFGLHTRRQCPLPAEGPGLIIANHRSPVDPLFILGTSGLKEGGRRIRIIEYMTAREYCEVGGVIGWICRVMRVIPVDRGGQDMRPAKEALRRLQAGRLVGVFPEGRLNTGEGLLPASPGIAWLALRSGVPVFPIFIHNAPSGRNMVEPFYNYCQVQVTYGDPIDLSEYTGRKRTPELLQEVTQLLMRNLAELGGISWEPQTEEQAPDLEESAAQEESTLKMVAS